MSLAGSPVEGVLAFTEEHDVIWWLAYLAGVGLILLSVSDVFMTVLYVRAGTGPMSHRLASGAWAVTRRVARPLLRGLKDTVLTFFGPVFLVALTTIWVGGWRSWASR